MFHRIYRMLVKEFLQMLRDPRMRVVIFGVPVIQMTVMAFALTTDVTNIRTAVLDRDLSPASRELLDRFSAAGYFRITHVVESDRELAELLDRGSIRVALTIPAGFGGTILSGRTAEFQMITDGTDSNSSAIALGYAQMIVNTMIDEKVTDRLARQGQFMQPAHIGTAERAWFNANQESRFYYVPSLIATMLFIFSLLLTSIGIVREKEVGTIEQVMVTPLRGIELILGKTIPYMITGYISMTIMLIVAFLVFDVQVKGSLPLLYLLTGIFLMGNLGLALIISTTASTQQQALLTSFLVLMPSVMLSGFLFPIANMPEPVQWATMFNPMRWYLEILRGIVMKGIGFTTLWPTVAAQSALAISFITLAAFGFRKRIN